MYAIVFSAGAIYILRLIAEGTGGRPPSHADGAARPARRWPPRRTRPRHEPRLPLIWAGLIAASVLLYVLLGMVSIWGGHPLFRWPARARTVMR